MCLNRAILNAITMLREAISRIDAASALVRRKTASGLSGELVVAISTTGRKSLWATACWAMESTLNAKFALGAGTWGLADDGAEPHDTQTRQRTENTAMASIIGRNSTLRALVRFATNVSATSD